MKRLLLFMSLLAVLLATRPAEATHFRGAAMIPEVDANGILTVTTTTFWDPNTFQDDVNSINVPGVTTSRLSVVRDTSDSRFARVTEVFTSDTSLASAGTYNISWDGCCRVEVNPNGGNWSENDWEMNSSIVWNGSSAAKPIDFNFGSVQSEVSRIASYSQSLNATSPDGLALTYNQALNLNINSQPEGFLINPATGQMTIPAGAGGTAAYADNFSDIGADRAFSGNIIASDGSFVEFDWMFDGVDQNVNQAPVIPDSISPSQGNPGDVFSFTFVASDPDGDPVTLDAALFAILGPIPAILPIFDSLTGNITWDSLGSAFGNYIFQARGFDPSGLSGVGSWTVVLSSGGTGSVPEPTAFVVWGCLIGLGLTRRRG